MAVNSTKRQIQKPDGAGNLIKFGREETSTINISYSNANYYVAATNTFFDNINLYGNTLSNNIVLKSNNLNKTNFSNTFLPVSAYWASIAYGGGSFVVVSGRGYAKNSFSASSNDGITWTLRTMPISANWDDIIYANNSFFALGGTATEAPSAYSTDGITWTITTLPPSNGWGGIVYGNGSFVAMGGSSTADAASSTNGITWTLRTLPASEYWGHIIYENNSFIALGGTFNATSNLATSTDGITWNLRTLPLSIVWASVAYGNNIFLVAASSNSNLAYSTNGITWTTKTSTNNGWSRIFYNNNLFFLVGDSLWSYSKDGITWTNINPNIKLAPPASAGNPIINVNNKLYTVAINIANTYSIIAYSSILDNTSYGIWEG